ncbi:MAG: hypothetical protein J5511_00900 [Bacilli bacterium]|nr:hypothetical protein [Bacilli bacterium]
MLNAMNQYIFNIYHYLLNLRDTVEYTIDREHTKQIYDTRKNVLLTGIGQGSALGNFFENNKEQGDKIKERLNEVIKDFYSDDNTVIKVTEDGKIRVDHTQHIKIFDEIVGIQESIRDILFGYINYARQQNSAEEDMEKLVAIDERLTRSIFAMLIMREFEKSFAEFQKVMSESKGQPTPQSNFIVQNEISKMASLIRFSRAHAHNTDNETLDLLDDVNKVIEMTEGRRDRRDNKSFQEIFNDINRRLSDHVAKLEPQWKEIYEKLFKEMVEISQKKEAENKQA